MRRLGSHIYAAGGEKLRYLVVGACNTLVSYGLFVALLASLGVWLQTFSGSASGLLSTIGEHYYLVVQWVGWVLAVPVSALTMKRFAFRSTGHSLHQIGRAYLVYLPAQGLATVLLWVMVQVAHLTPQVGVIVVVVVTTVLTYLGHKYFTFRVPLEVGEVPQEELLD
jgi:putative flippase GtrA